MNCFHGVYEHGGRAGAGEGGGDLAAHDAGLPQAAGDNLARGPMDDVDGLTEFGAQPPAADPILDKALERFTDKKAAA